MTVKEAMQITDSEYNFIDVGNFLFRVLTPTLYLETVVDSYESCEVKRIYSLPGNSLLIKIK